MRRLFILRPEPGATASLERARALGLDAVAAPLFRLEPVAWEPPEPAHFDGLLLTSANAVLMAGGGLAELRGLKAYAVGEATSQAARDAGFDVAATGDQGVDRLLGSIEPGLRLLHIAGEDRRPPSLARQEITAVTVYRASELAAPQALRAIAGATAAVHSPRAGGRLAELLDAPVKARVRIACISEAAAQAAGRGWEIREVACEPGDSALLALAARLCDKPVQE